jgi:hypothetical protein
VNGLISTVLSLATSTESSIPGRSMTSCLSEGFCGSESQKVTVVGGTEAVLLVAVASLGFCVRTHLSWRRKQSARPRVWVEVTGFIYCCPQVVLPHSSSSYNDIYQWYIYIYLFTYAYSYFTFFKHTCMHTCMPAYNTKIHKDSINVE